MANRTFRSERHCCLLLLVYFFLAGSGLWLKLILSDVLAFDLSYTLLYEREFLPSSKVHWSVARGLQISADLSECEIKQPGKPDTGAGRRLDPRAGALLPDGPAGPEERGFLGDSGLSFRPLSSSPVVDDTGPSSAAALAGSAGHNKTTPPAAPPSVAPVAAPPLPHINHCDVDTARVQVNATLAVLEQPIGPLYFVVYFSQDWHHWFQVSSSPPPTPQPIPTPQPTRTGTSVGLPSRAHPPPGRVLRRRPRPSTSRTPSSPSSRSRARPGTTTRRRAIRRTTTRPAGTSARCPRTRASATRASTTSSAARSRDSSRGGRARP